MQEFYIIGPSPNPSLTRLAVHTRAAIPVGKRATTGSHSVNHVFKSSGVLKETVLKRLVVLKKSCLFIRPCTFMLIQRRLFIQPCTFMLIQRRLFIQPCTVVIIVAPTVSIKYAVQHLPYKLAYKPPLCGPCGRNEGFLGGLIAKGGLYASCVVR